MKLSEDLIYRGLIKDKTFGNIAWLDKPHSFYVGIDPSADSLTIGHLALLCLALRLARSGWKPIILVGGATSLIGDPGGKSTERDLKTKAEIEHNVKSIKRQIEILFAGQKFEMVNNYDWSKNLNLLDFLRDVGKHYPLSELVNRDFIIDRLSEKSGGISFTEFSYTLLQGYDFWHLFKTKNVNLQIGGSDQWGNMLSGVGLIRKRESREAHALSMPLIINKLTGTKFGKSETGTVWLDERKTSIYKFYQFWLNVDDTCCEEYLKVFTALTDNEVSATMAVFTHNRSNRDAQKVLAYEVTKLVHGADKTDAIRRTCEVLFSKQGFFSLSLKDQKSMKQELPVVSAKGDVVLVDLLRQTGLANSNSEALRYIAAGAISLNGQKVIVNQHLEMKAGNNLLKRGKNSLAIVEYK